jgi:hypothetical protein
MQFSVRGSGGHSASVRFGDKMPMVPAVYADEGLSRLERGIFVNEWIQVEGTKEKRGHFGGSRCRENDGNNRS